MPSLSDQPGWRPDDQARTRGDRGVVDVRTSWAGALRVPLRAGGLGLWTSGMVSVAAIDELRHPAHARYEVFQRHMRVWARGLLELFGVGVHIAQDHRDDIAPRGRLVVANHRSPIDIIILLHTFGGCCVSRADLANWPVLGLAARRADTIFVDRQDPRSGAKAIRAMRDRLRLGRTVIAFPEGGTFDGDEVRAFRGGAFAAARGLDVDIVPVGLAYPPGAAFVNESFGEHLVRTAQRVRTPVTLCIGAPRPVHGTRDADRLAAQRDVQALVTEARGAHAGSPMNRTWAQYVP